MMLDALTGFVGKALGAFAGPAWKYLVARFRRPQISLEKAPTNLLEHLGPAASAERVRSILGPPHQVVDAYWFYRFADALVQVQFWPDGGAKSVALGLVGKGKNNRFPVPGCAKPLGRLSIADVREEQDTLRRRTSMRHEEVIIEARVGPRGAWVHYTFGALRAVGAKALLESYFDWDTTRDCLRTDPSFVLVNWVAVSNSSEEVYFDWSLA